MSKDILRNYNKYYHSNSLCEFRKLLSLDMRYNDNKEKMFTFFKEIDKLNDDVTFYNRLHSLTKEELQYILSKDLLYFNHNINDLRNDYNYMNIKNKFKMAWNECDTFCTQAYMIIANK